MLFALGYTLQYRAWQAPVESSDKLRDAVRSILLRSSDMPTELHLAPVMAQRGGISFQLEGRWYDVTPDFQHPGGPQVLAEHAGEDISQVFNGDLGGHAHSRAARAMLQKYERKGSAQPVGETCSPQQPQTPVAEDGVAAAGAFIDESKPLLQQVWQLGPAYEQWVNCPVPGQPRFFQSEWAERVTKVKWWVVPLLWLPLVAYTFGRALLAAQLPLGAALLLGGLGILIWGLVEYCIHRFVFHAHPRSRWAIFLHFLFHGNHHKYPMDVERLVFPPIPASWVVYAFYCLLHALLPQGAALAVFSGMLLGYVAYDCTHYFQHSGVVGGALRAAHMHHHYGDHTANYGISSSLFDWFFGTFAAGKSQGRRGAASAGKPE